NCPGFQFGNLAAPMMIAEKGGSSACASMSVINLSIGFSKAGLGDFVPRLDPNHRRIFIGGLSFLSPFRLTAIASPPGSPAPFAPPHAAFAPVAAWAIYPSNTSPHEFDFSVIPAVPH